MLPPSTTTTTTTSPGPPAKAAQAPGDALWDSSWVPGAGEATIAAHAKSSTTPPAELTLYSSWFCPFAQRAWIACEEKGVKYEYVEVNPYEVDATKPGGYTKRQLPLEIKRSLHPGFVEASPKGLVPAVRFNKAADETLCESKPIIEYVDLKFGDASTLLPSDPYERAYCRVWADYADEKIQRPYYKLLIDQNTEARDAAFKQMLDGARQFARAMRPVDDGPYFLGERFTYVDVSFAPFWQRILSVGKHYRGVELPSPTDDADFQRLDAWWTAVRDRPSVANTIVCADRLIASYWGYAANQATSDYAQGIFGSLSKSTRDASPLAVLGMSSSPGNVAASAKPLAALLTACAVSFAVGVVLGRSSLTGK